MKNVSHQSHKNCVKVLGKSVIAVATSVIAARLIKTGKSAHFALMISFSYEAENICHIFADF